MNFQTRSRLGADQNRLEHAKGVANNMEENLQSAESKMRDANMADEMVTYRKEDILQQAGHAILTQAKQSTQGILKLLE